MGADLHETIVRAAGVIVRKSSKISVAGAIPGSVRPGLLRTWSPLAPPSDEDLSEDSPVRNGQFWISGSGLPRLRSRHSRKSWNAARLGRPDETTGLRDRGSEAERRLAGSSGFWNLAPSSCVYARSRRGLRAAARSALRGQIEVWFVQVNGRACVHWKSQGLLIHPFLCDWIPSLAAGQKRGEGWAPGGCKCGPNQKHPKQNL
jgi:hypothetical protein